MRVEQVAESSAREYCLFNDGWENAVCGWVLRWGEVITVSIGIIQATALPATRDSCTCLYYANDQTIDRLVIE